MLYKGSPKELITTKELSKGHNSAYTIDGLRAEWKKDQKNPKKSIIQKLKIK